MQKYMLTPKDDPYQDTSYIGLCISFLFMITISIDMKINAKYIMIHKIIDFILNSLVLIQYYQFYYIKKNKLFICAFLYVAIGIYLFC